MNPSDPARYACSTCGADPYATCRAAYGHAAPPEGDHHGARVSRAARAVESAADAALRRDALAAARRRDELNAAVTAATLGGTT